MNVAIQRLSYVIALVLAMPTLAGATVSNIRPDEWKTIESDGIPGETQRVQEEDNAIRRAPNEAQRSAKLQAALARPHLGAPASPMGRSEPIRIKHSNLQQAAGVKQQSGQVPTIRVETPLFTDVSVRRLTNFLAELGDMGLLADGVLTRVIIRTGDRLAPPSQTEGTTLVMNVTNIEGRNFSFMAGVDGYYQFAEEAFGIHLAKNHSLSSRLDRLFRGFSKYYGSNNQNDYVRHFFPANTPPTVEEDFGQTLTAFLLSRTANTNGFPPNETLIQQAKQSNRLLGKLVEGVGELLETGSQPIGKKKTRSDLKAIKFAFPSGGDPVLSQVAFAQFIRNGDRLVTQIKLPGQKKPVIKNIPNLLKRI